MIDTGILKEDDRVELIRGEIVAKMPIGDPHVAAVNRLNRILGRKVADAATVSVQNPVRLADSEPEPDITLIVPREDDYSTGKPLAVDVLLVIEVADSSLELDREVKAQLYAENAISEYWIVNLVDNCLEVRREPRPDGTYADVRILRSGDSIDLVNLPGLTITVADLFPR